MNIFNWLIKRFTARQQTTDDEPKDPISVKQAVFVKQFTLQKQLALLDKQTYHLLSEGDWKFSDKYYLYEKLDQLLKYIEKATCKRLHLSGYKAYPNLPRNINLPHFSKLNFLMITDCQISSIQLLSFLDAPQLVNSFIKGTHTTIFKPFDKIYWPQLELLVFRDNQVQSILSLGRVTFNKRTDFISIDEGQNCYGSLIFVKSMQLATNHLCLIKTLGQGNNPKVLKAICRKLDIKNKD